MMQCLHVGYGQKAEQEQCQVDSQVRHREVVSTIQGRVVVIVAIKHRGIVYCILGRTDRD